MTFGFVGSGCLSAFFSFNTIAYGLGCYGKLGKVDPSTGGEDGKNDAEDAQKPVEAIAAQPAEVDSMVPSGEGQGMNV